MKIVSFALLSFLKFQTKIKTDVELRKVDQRLLQLQSSLKKEQSRMKSLLASKDLMTSQLQIQLEKLRKENKTLALLAGVKGKFSFNSEKSLEDHKNNSKIIVKPRNELSSDSGCENLTSDNASLSDENSEGNPDNQLNLSASTIISCSKPHVQAPLSEMYV